jgi:signal transduction histidine kinase
LRSVRARILASMLAVTAAGMLVAGGTSYLVQRERTLSQIDERLSSAVAEARFVAQDAAPATYADALRAVVQRVRPETDEGTFALVDGRTAIVPGGDIPMHPERDPAFVARIGSETASGNVVRGTATTTAGMVRYVAIPIKVQGDPGAGVFVIVVDVNARLRAIDDAFLTFAAVAAASLVVVGLVGWFVAGRLLAPIRHLRETAARITGSDTSERIEVIGTDDVSDLTVTVNGMLDRLDVALTGQRQLLDDVGHELKTPITIVRGHLELMQPDDPEEVEATRVLAIDELDRMGSLVRDISDLATVQRPLRLALSAADIGELTRGIRTKASALSSQHLWVVTGAAEVVAVVDADRLTQAMLQLAANAVSHGSPSGRIELGSSVARGRLVFWVSDNGPGIEPENAKGIFERFRRARLGRGTGGSGLGLAIVSAIADAHGGSARVDSVPGHGATFVIDIPLVTVNEPNLTEAPA